MVIISPDVFVLARPGRCRAVSLEMDSLPDQQTIRKRAAHEAVERLGLLRPEAAETIIDLLSNFQGEHPRSACAAYRKTGEQLSDDEKRAIGIRSNAYLSRAALAEISEKGMEDPIRAHETTLLRASFVILRHRNAQSSARMMVDHPDYPVEIQYDVFHPDACPICASLDRTPVPRDWGLFAPVGCTCVTAPYGLRSEVDFLAPLRTTAKKSAAKSEISFLARLRAYFTSD